MLLFNGGRMNQRIKEQTITLIDVLTAICQSYGLGNDGN